MVLWWLASALLVYVGAGALAAFVLGALTLGHRVRFGPLPPRVTVPPGPAAPAEPEGSAAEIALTEASVLPADVS